MNVPAIWQKYMPIDCYFFSIGICFDSYNSQSKLFKTLQSEPIMNDYQSQSNFELGREQYSKGNYAEAAKCTENLRRTGIRMLNIIWDGAISSQGVTKNLTEAKKWYQKAADKGHESAKKKLVELSQ